MLPQARGGTSQGQRRKSIRVPAPQTFVAGSQGEPPQKRRTLACLDEEESSAGSNETEEPEDIDLEDTSGSSEPRVEHIPEVVSSEAKEEVLRRMRMRARMMRIEPPLFGLPF